METQRVKETAKMETQHVVEVARVKAAHDAQLLAQQKEASQTAAEANYKASNEALRVAKEIAAKDAKAAA